MVDGLTINFLNWFYLLLSNMSILFTILRMNTMAATFQKRIQQFCVK